MNVIRSCRIAVLASLLLCVTRGQAQPAEPTPEAPTEGAPAEGRPAEGQPAEGQPAEGQPAEGQPPPTEKIAADAAEIEKAKNHFKQGLAFATSGDCKAAIVEFLAAYEVVPRPNMLYNIAQCQERLFRYDLAVRYYEQYLEEAPADAPDRLAVEAALKTLRNLLGTISIASNIPAEVWVGDRIAGEAPGDVLLPSGSHTIELRAEGYIPTRKEASLVGGETITLEFKLVKAQTTIEVTETTGIAPWLFWSGVTATTLVAITGGVFALQAKSEFDEADMLDPFDPMRASAKTDIEDAEFRADLSFAIAGALGLGTVIIAFMTDWDGEKPPRVPADDGTEETAHNVRVTPLLGPDNFGLQVGGTL